jgi:hypothetical protein
VGVAGCVRLHDRVVNRRLLSAESRLLHPFLLPLSLRAVLRIAG